MIRIDAPGKPGPCSPYAKQQAASLLISLLILIVVSLLGASAVHIALMGEKSARNDRDRHIAFQAAEAALLDAEMDIENSLDPLRARSKLFGSGRAEGFTEGCGAGEHNIHMGLCRRAAEGGVPVWLAVDFLDAGQHSARSVPYGKFTGQSFQVGSGSLPGRLPRYIIELMAYPETGQAADLGAETYFYRITALGFGMQDTSRVALQTFYRKDE